MVTLGLVRRMLRPYPVMVNTEGQVPYDPAIHHRRSIRLKGFDYTLSGAYFVTLNTWKRDPIFGDVTGDVVFLSPVGEIIRQYWLKLPDLFPIDLDAWVIMPDHLHGIILIHGRGEASGGSGGNEVKESAPDASPSQPHGTNPNSLSAVVQNFKSITTRKINQQRGAPGGQVWQRNYYEHAIRDETDLERIRRYIAANPYRWSQGFHDP